jgi:hypothetical protein
MRRAGSYNLPCFHQLFKQLQEELNIDFQDLYFVFSQEEDE